MHEVHIRKAGYNWNVQSEGCVPGPAKWDHSPRLDERPRNYPIRGATWENFMPMSALIAHMPGAAFPITLAISLQKKGDYQTSSGVASTVQQHLVRLDQVPREFDNVFAQPVHCGWRKS